MSCSSPRRALTKQSFGRQTNDERPPAQAVHPRTSAATIAHRIRDAFGQVILETVGCLLIAIATLIPIESPSPPSRDEPNTLRGSHFWDPAKTRLLPIRTEIQNRDREDQGRIVWSILVTNSNVTWSCGDWGVPAAHERDGLEPPAGQAIKQEE